MAGRLDLRCHTLNMKQIAVIAALVIGVWFVLGRAGGRLNSALDTADVGASLAGAIMTGGPNVKMSLSGSGLDAIAQREGFSSYRYKDADGYSIGFGHFIQVGEFFSEPISRVEALQLLSSDAAIAESAVRAYVKVPISRVQFDALVSFVYNVGSGAFKNSTLLRLLNQGDTSGAARQFPNWNKSQGVVIPALIARRTAEQQQFLA